MRIITVKKDTVIVEMKKNEIKYFTDKSLYDTELERLCKDDVNFPVGEWSNNFRTTCSYDVKNAIKSLESATKFLNNQFEDLLKAGK